jgi:tryptophan synthase alpha chain
MKSNRLVSNLRETLDAGGKCLIPYVTAGYPNVEATESLVRRLDAAGCQAVEVGFPFSDSIADGPVIQESFYRALDAGFRVSELFAAVESVRRQVSTALLAMVSMSVVRKIGPGQFAQQAAQVGFDGLIVPDVPVDECGSLGEIAAAAGLCNVLMAAPTSPGDRRRMIVRHSTGFVYLIAARGITGEREGLSEDLAASVASMRRAGDLPVMLGFGLSTPEQVAQVCRMADGAIVGSAVIRRMTACIDEGGNNDEMVEAVGSFVDGLAAGTSIS